MSELHVLSVGVAAGPGAGALNVTLALRAGWHERVPRAFDGGTVLAVPCDAAIGGTRSERIITLLTRALTDVFREPPRSEPKAGSKRPLVLILPEDLAEHEATCVDAVRTHDAVDPSRVFVIRGGANATLVALAKASELVDARHTPQVLVGAADSLITSDVLGRLVKEGLVTPSGWSSGPVQGGLIPGEGAGFMLLSGRAEDERLASIETIAGGFDLGQALSIGAKADRELSVVAVPSLVGVDPEALVEGLREARSQNQSVLFEISEATEPLGHLGAATSLVDTALAARLGALASEGRACLVVLRASENDAAVVRVEPVQEVALGVPTTGRRDALAEALRAAIRSIPQLRRVSGEALSKLSVPKRRRFDRALSALSSAFTASLGAGPSSREAVCAAQSAIAAIAGTSDDLRHVVTVLGALEARLGRLEADRGSDGPPMVVPLAFLLCDRVPQMIALPFVSATPRAEPSASFDDDETNPEEPEGAPSDDDDSEDDDAEDAPIKAGAAASDNDDNDDEIASLLSLAIDGIASAWLRRRPYGDAPWSPELVREDEAILRGLDWIHGLLRAQDAPRSAVSMRDLLGADSVVDAGAAFARTLALACSADVRLVEAAVEKARAPAPELSQAYEDALALGANPRIDDTLSALLVDDSSQSKELALRVSARRRNVRVGATTPALFHVSVDVRIAAARALGAATAKEAATLALDTRLSTESNPRVSAEIAVSLMRLGAPHGETVLAHVFTELLRDPHDPEVTRARLVLGRTSACAGRVVELPQFAALLRTPTELEVLGWFGRTLAVDRLLDAQDDEDEEIQRASTLALMRILGVTLTQDKRKLELTESALPDFDIAPEHATRLPMLFRGYWGEHVGRFGRDTKYRFGKAWRPEVARDELMSLRKMGDRASLALELELNGHIVPDLEDWVSRQVAGLAGRGAFGSARSR